MALTLKTPACKPVLMTGRTRTRMASIAFAAFYMASVAHADDSAEPTGVASSGAPAQATIANPPSEPQVAGPVMGTRDRPEPSVAPSADVRADIPVVTFAHSAFGTGAMKIGAQAFGFGQTAADGGVGGGGLTIYGSPLDRLT